MFEKKIRDKVEYTCTYCILRIILIRRHIENKMIYMYEINKQKQHD